MEKKDIDSQPYILDLFVLICSSKIYRVQFETER